MCDASTVFCKDIWLQRLHCRLCMAKLFASIMNALRSFLAMTSRTMPVTNNNSPAMTSMTAPMRVGNRATTPVFQKSTVTMPHSTMPMTPMTQPTPPKNGNGLYSRIMRKMVAITLIPSPTVSSLLTDPSGRSRYWIGISNRRRLLFNEWMVISVSTSKPRDNTG